MPHTHVAYYPGCSLEGTARDYADSIEAVCRSLHVVLHEVPDWNCCGATAVHSISPKTSVELAARNLDQASHIPYRDMVVPCPLCFNRLKTAAWELQGEHRRSFRVRLRRTPPKIWDLAEFFATEKMLEVLQDAVVRPLEDLRVVCYYGCMANRPPHIKEAPNPENPMSMDRIVSGLGARVLAWPFKTDCCGASLMIPKPEMGYRLVGRLLDMAHRVGAQAIVVSCQMCHANLDMHQNKVAAAWGKDLGMPVVYFTELMGLACGIPGAADWMARHFVDPRPMFRDLGLLPDRAA